MTVCMADIYAAPKWHTKGTILKNKFLLNLSLKNNCSEQVIFETDIYDMEDMAYRLPMDPFTYMD